MRPITVTVGPLVTANASNIAQSQTPTTAFTLNGSLASAGIATLDTYRRVRITTGGSEAGKTATVTGTTFGGQAASETVNLPASATTVDTVLDYLTVTSITVSAGLGAAATVGTSPVAGSPWVYFDPWSASNIGFQVTTSGTINYTAQQTLDDPNSPTNPVTAVNVTWVNSSDSNVVSASSTQQSNYFFTPAYGRIVVNSSTNPGKVTATYIQSENAPL